VATIQEINCRIDELTPEQQIGIVRLINMIASHPPLWDKMLELYSDLEIHICPECEKVSKAYGPRQPEYGLDIRVSGGYGMFIDDWDTEFDETICHDCTIKLAKLFPNTIGKYLKA